ncbi:MAG: HAMP domain-containing protein, partial [Anaerolineales bacterium]
MNKSWLSKFLDTLLRRTGGWYFLVIVAIAQLVAIPGAIIGAITVQTNANFSPEQVQMGGMITAISVPLGNAILLIAAWTLSRHARNRLDKWAKEQPLDAGTQEEISAWRESTAFAWRYGILATFVALVVDVMPGIIYQSVYLGATYDQSIYSLIGGGVSAIGTVIIAVLAIERMLVPAREVLVPQKFEDQISGALGLPIISKFLVVILAIIVFTVLLIAPVGYRQTVRSITYEIDSRQALAELQSQSLILSGAALAMGAILALLISQSVSQPIRSLIKVFEKIQAGDLSQRAPVLSTDEVGELAVHFNRMVTRLEELQGNLENQVRQRTAQLQATNEVGRIASSILDETKLASEVVNLIVSRFNYYHAAIFLVDSSGVWAELKEATGKAGQTLRAQH